MDNALTDQGAEFLYKHRSSILEEIHLRNKSISWPLVTFSFDLKKAAVSIPVQGQANGIPFSPKRQKLSSEGV